MCLHGGCYSKMNHLSPAHSTPYAKEAARGGSPDAASKKAVERTSLSGERKEGNRNPLGFGYNVRKACVRPSNVTAGDLPGNEVFTEAVLEFLGNIGVGVITAGAILDKA